MSRAALEKFPKVNLLFGKSPIHRLDRLTEHLGGDVEIWAKREDVNSGLAYGGNKTRKLEYLAADALAKGCDTLVSIGGVQSNHTRQVAATAAHLGMKAVLVQEHWVEWNEVNYEKTGNILLSRVMGAEVRLDPAGFDIGFRASWEKAIQDVIDRGGKPYAIPAGASDHELGGHGFAGWAFEVEDQEKELGFKFDKTIVCSVTGSSQGGMIAGFAHSNRAQDVIGIDASESSDAAGMSFVKAHDMNWPQLSDMKNKTKGTFGLGVPVSRFIDVDGKTVYEKIGPFKSFAEIQKAAKDFLGVKI